MRPVMLALLGLMLAATPGLAATARQGGGATAGGRQAEARGDGRAHGLAHGPLQAGHGRPGRVQARVQAASWVHHRAPARIRFGWTHGLTPAARVQASECPDGTMSTLAHGHDDVVRCMPI